MNYVISIINPDSLDRLSAICEELSLPLSVILHGHGTAVQSMLDLLGIESTEKRIVLSVASDEKTAALITAEKHHLHIGVPGHGIVIAVPVKSIGGGKAVAYLNGDNKLEKHAPTLNYAYELIVAIASEGSTDMVMNAARAAGARGGTVLHGKGTGAKDAPKFYNISIAEERSLSSSSLPRIKSRRLCAKSCARQAPVRPLALSSFPCRPPRWQASDCLKKTESYNKKRLLWSNLFFVMLYTVLLNRFCLDRIKVCLNLGRRRGRQQ